jgi:hypothetical protein
MKTSRRSLKVLIGSAAVASAVVGSTSVASAAAITPGNVMVCRVGTGTGSLVNTGNAVFLDEYTPAGVLVQSIAMPTAVAGANKPLIVSGTATSECQVNLSGDGRYVVLAGYGTAPGGTASLSGTTSAAVNRVIGRVDAAGVVDTTTALNNYSSGNNPRAATSDDGTSFWAVGGAGGVVTAPLGATAATPVSATAATANLRQVTIAGGNLYVSSSSGTTRIAQVGTGLPTTSGQTITNLPGTPTTGSPYGIVFADLTSTVPGVDTLYLTEDTTATVGIRKYSLVGGTWTLNGTIAAAAVRGLAGSVSGGSVQLFGSTGGSTATGGGTLYSVVDATGYNVAPTATAASIATAGANQAFRGVALAPIEPSVVPESPLGIVMVGAAGAAVLVFAAHRSRRTASI